MFWRLHNIHQVKLFKGEAEIVFSQQPKVMFCRKRWQSPSILVLTQTKSQGTMRHFTKVDCFRILKEQLTAYSQRPASGTASSRRNFELLFLPKDKPIEKKSWGQPSPESADSGMKILLSHRSLFPEGHVKVEERFSLRILSEFLKRVQSSNSLSSINRNNHPRNENTRQDDKQRRP